MQLVMPDDRVILEQTIQRNVRFLGDNLRATSKLAKNAAKVLNRSTLPTPSSLKAQQAAVNAAAGL